MMNKIIFEVPVIELVKIDVMDVIRTSGELGGDGEVITPPDEF